MSARWTHRGKLQCPPRDHACAPGTVHEFGTGRNLFPARQRAGTRGETPGEIADGVRWRPGAVGLSVAEELPEMVMETDGTESGVGRRPDSAERKWGSRVMEQGYSIVPSLLFRAQRRLGLNATQLALLLHLADHWWARGRLPFPLKRTLGSGSTAPRDCTHGTWRQAPRCTVPGRCWRSHCATRSTRVWRDASGRIGTISSTPGWPLGVSAGFRKRSARSNCRKRLSRPDG